MKKYFSAIEIFVKSKRFSVKTDFLHIVVN